MLSKPSLTNQAHLLIVFLAFISSANYLPLKIAALELHPLAVIAWRFLIGALVIAVFSPRASFSLSRSEFSKGLVTGALFYLGGVLALFSLQSTQSGITAFLIGTCALFVPFIEYSVMRRLPTGFQILGLLIATIGLYFLAFKQDLQLDIGAVFGLTSAVAFALWAVALSYYSKILQPMKLGFSQIFGVAALALVVCCLSGKFQIPALANTWYCLIFLGAVSVAFRFMAQTWAQSNTTATSVEIIYLVEPCGALLWGYLFAAEVATVHQLFGCAVIVVGVLVAQLRGFKSVKG